MKVRTRDAAARLGIHPAHLLLHIGQLDKSMNFEDVWPEIDEGLIETVAVSTDHKPRSPFGSSAGELECDTSRSMPRISHNALRVLDKLQRQNKWAGVCVTHEALMNISHLPSSDLQEALDELRKMLLLDHDGSGRGGTVSLDPAKRKEIEEITGHSC